MENHSNPLRVNQSTRNFVPEGISTIPGEARRVFHGEIYDVFQWPQELFDGTMATFEMLRRADTVQIVGIKNNKVVILRQRQPRSDWHFGLPGGRNDMSGEDELVAAKREMREETGMEFASWELINVIQPFSKIDWLVYSFLATDFISQGPQSLDGGEEIIVEELEFGEALRLAEDSLILGAIKVAVEHYTEKI